MAGPGFSKPMIFLGFNLLLCNCAVALSNMCSCIFVSIELSTVVLCAAMEITRLYSAFFVSPVLLLKYPKWSFFDQISYMKYGYIGLCLNEYTDLVLTCTPAQLVFNKPNQSVGVCQYTSGQQLNALYGYTFYNVDYCAGMMIVYIIVCRIASYLALRFIKV